MRQSAHRILMWAVVVAFFSACASTGGSGTSPKPAAEDDIAALAKESQNPITSMRTLPLQNNTSFGIGPHDRTANVLNVQPILPVKFDDFLVINRLIAPVVYSPYPDQNEGGVWGLGDVNYTAWICPPAKGLTWGIGPVVSFPTATDDFLGSDKWSAGPSVVAVAMSGPWVYGGLVNNIWSFAGDSDREEVNELYAQPFVNYNLDGGWFLVTGPIITADWKKDQGDRWIVPIGGGIGRVFSAGGQLMNFNVQAFKKVVKPDGAADWSLRLQLTFLFPKPPSVPKEE